MTTPGEAHEGVAQIVEVSDSGGSGDLRLQLSEGIECG